LQNILAGQEAIEINLIVISDAEVARDNVRATAGLLAFSRKLVLRLCTDNTVLSEHNAAEQLRVNQISRKNYAMAQKVLPTMLRNDFNERYSPHFGWDEFEKRFRKSPLAAVKTVDPFWEISGTEGIE
jgi:hypothetical protein